MKLFGVWTVLILFILPSNEVIGHSGTSDQPVFHVSGSHFLNTQVANLCLLAQLNATIQITYRSPGAEHTMETYDIPLPASASTEGSYCDMEYHSLLTLSFDDVTMQLLFMRDEVTEVEAQRVYCNTCDIGNWKLEKVKVSVGNVSNYASGSLSPPPTRVEASAWGNTINGVALALNEGVRLQRAYKCSQEIVIGLDINDAIDQAENHNHTEQWRGRVVFDFFQVQPFLVTDDIFKDPLLCKDVTIFHALVITLPLIYFIALIVCYRVKDRYGCPPDCSKKPPDRQNSAKTDMKPLVTSQRPQKFRIASSGSTQSQSITVTCTPPDQSEPCVA
ncbi:uncharacterized protein LOC143470988 [Clavelina lepadiformis]|uniref:uncharacterized protein LOC143470988 n=1 Tax=Clavelina lepadiformis TaxID=159417 RepID=UPI00404215D3